MSIRFHYSNKKYKLQRTEEIKKLISRIILKKNKLPGRIDYILTGDEELLQINKEFLRHNYYTDVIAFDYSVSNTVNGEIYISRDTVKRNAQNYEVSYRSEILRVIIHGTLHLCGMTDEDDKSRREMRSEEDFWLKMLI